MKLVVFAASVADAATYVDAMRGYTTHGDAWRSATRLWSGMEPDPDVCKGAIIAGDCPPWAVNAQPARVVLLRVSHRGTLTATEVVPAPCDPSYDRALEAIGAL